MIDRFRLHVKGGDGGSGCGSARRSRQDRYGKPDGGCSYSKLYSLSAQLLPFKSFSSTDMQTDM